MVKENCNIDPLVMAVLEISEASERSATERLRRRYLSSLLQRTDRILDSLEEMNLLDVPRVPEAWPLHIATVVADLPFDYSLGVTERPTPTEAIELVFDVQQALLHWMTGREAEVEELEPAV